ncbi:hypothetical protein chiPu_0028568, partial [Chiloscyllium punctatum]|nr:hypothetical protein [Chiloscyllium punctatum]
MQQPGGEGRKVWDFGVWGEVGDGKVSLRPVVPSLPKTRKRPADRGDNPRNP